MRRQESLWLKFIRYWFGIDSRLDERQLAEVERIGKPINDESLGCHDDS